MSRFIIVGAPCSGKSTYVRESARAGDLIFDYDTLHQSLSGQASHDHLTEIRPYVLAARDAIFEQLEVQAEQPAWLITSTRKAAELSRLSARFGAEIVFLEVSRDEAHRRCTAASRPDEWHTYIDNWFDEADIEIDPKSRRDTMKQKTFTAPLRLKADGEPGEFQAVFATLNVVDLDGDVTLPGAFSEQEVLIEPWNHDRTLPTGKGQIKSNETEAWVEGQFFLDTNSGNETYKTVKNLGPLAQWSYKFNVEDAGHGQHNGDEVYFLRKMDVVGVGPVNRGAGINTRTTDIKEQKPPQDELPPDPPGSANDSEADNEGEAGDGKPSGIGPSVVLAQIEIIELEI